MTLLQSVQVWHLLTVLSATHSPTGLSTTGNTG